MEGRQEDKPGSKQDRKKPSLRLPSPRPPPQDVFLSRPRSTDNMSKDVLCLVYPEQTG